MTCEQCFGERVIPIPQQEWPPGVFQPMRPCPCTAKTDSDEYLNRVWARLAEATPARSSPLGKHVGANLRISSSLGDLRRHLAKVARDNEKKLAMRVCSDIDLITAWLYSAGEIHDPEAAETRDRDDVATYPRLSSLVDPPDLLVLLLGMKMAPNRGAPNVVMETLVSREILDKPTWVVERVGAPLGPRHPSYSEELLALLASWTPVTLTKVAEAPEPVPRVVALPCPAGAAPPGAPGGYLDGRLPDGRSIEPSREKERRKRKGMIG